MVELVACRYRTVRIQGELTWRNRWRTPREFRIGEAGGEGLGEWELMDFVPERRLEQPVTVVSMSSSTRSPTALRRTFLSLSLFDSTADWLAAVLSSLSAPALA